MLNLYISHKAFIECLTSENALTPIIRGAHVNVLAADQHLLDEIYKEDSYEQSLEQSLAQSCGFVISSGVDVAETVKAKGRKEKIKVRRGRSSSVFVLSNVDQSMIQEIENKLGVLCLSDDNIVFQSNVNHFEKCYGRGDSGSWEEFLSDMRGLPLNTIIINDHYLQQYPADSRKNLEDILRQLFKGKSYDFKVQVLIITGHRTEYIKDDQIRSILTPFFSISEELSINFKIETINCTGGFPLYKDTHNRFIITDYGIITADKTLAAFKDGKAGELQTIYWDSILSGEQNACDKYHIYRNTLFADINDALNKDNIDYRCAEWQQENNQLTKKEIDLSKIMNRQISEPQVGDPCFYISVPYQNDWANCEIKKGEFKADNYNYCVYATTEKELKDQVEQIKKLFANPCPYKQADENCEKFFRIIVSDDPNLKTIDYKEGSSKEVRDQKQYQNNCFAKEEDAIEVANKICSILKLERQITKH